MKEKSTKDNKTVATVVHRFLELKALGKEETSLKGAEMGALFPG